MRTLLAGLMLLAFTGCGLELNKADSDRRAPTSVGGVMAENPLQPATVAQADTPANGTPAEASTPEAASDAAAAEQTPTEGTPTQSTLENPGETPATPPAETQDPNTIREVVKAGSGKQGRYEGSGMVVTPVKAYFIGKQKIVFEVQIPHAVKLFQAENGRFPKDMAEFQSAILNPSQITLPELPRGHKYYYEPKTGELMVERPR
jgi:hypothetical protein